jgi:hypothetical protein
VLKLLSIVASLVAITTMVVTTVPVNAQEALSPSLILELKNGHLKTCGSFEKRVGYAA